jgi:hypothetical protein
MQAEIDDGRAQGLQSDEREELRELRRENLLVLRVRVLAGDPDPGLERCAGENVADELAVEPPDRCIS